jgi:hypothetical protein
MQWPTIDLVDLIDNNTQAFWLDEMTLMQLEFDKVFLMNIVGTYLSTQNISEHLDHYSSRYGYNIE